MNIVSEDDALVTVFDVDPSHTVGTLKEHMHKLYILITGPSPNRD